MKNIKNIIIVLLSIVIVGMLVIYFTVLKAKSNIDERTEKITYYLCEKKDKIKTEENMEISFKQKIIFDNVGEIEKVLEILEYKFQDKDFYESFKEWQQEKESIKEIDDKNKILTIEKELTELFSDSSEQPKSIWVKSYIEMLEQQGYICKQ